MTDKLSITDLPLKGQKVLMRVDFNVPLDKSATIKDDSRINSVLPTIEYALDHGASVIVMSHLGRPKGKRQNSLSLKPCSDHLSALLGKEVIFADDCVGHSVEKLACALEPGQVLMLENLRFHEAEEKPEVDQGFAKSLAKLADVYVNDAFGTAHRKHSSTYVVPKYFPEKAACGFLIEKEIQFLGNYVLNPERPFHAIIGGAKISSKLGVLNKLVEKVDALFIGGGMAFTFLKAMGYKIGNSLYEEDLIEDAREIMEKCRCNKMEFYLPIDLVITDKISDEAAHFTVDVEEGIDPTMMGVDIGQKTIDLFSSKLQVAKTIFWNGPLGVFEIPIFAEGTKQIAKEIASTNAVTIVGGGDSAAALQQVGYADRISHISTGGGALMEYIEKGTLPAIEVLTGIKVRNTRKN